MRTENMSRASKYVAEIVCSYDHRHQRRHQVALASPTNESRRDVAQQRVSKRALLDLVLPVVATIRFF